MRRLVPKDGLLEYRVSDGWAPLCRFLEVAVPDEKFPSGNKASAFRGRLRSALKYNVREFVSRFASVVWLIVQAVQIIHLYLHRLDTLFFQSQLRKGGNLVSLVHRDPGTHGAVICTLTPVTGAFKQARLTN